MGKSIPAAEQAVNGDDLRLQNTHVFMVSFPGQGHVNPLLRLGKRLANFGLLVTVCTPEFAGANIKQVNNISDGDEVEIGRGKIRFEFFDDGWDLNDPNRDKLEAYVAQLEQAGRKNLPEMIKKQEEMGRPVSCLINNPFIPWASDVAEELGIPSAMLWVQSCASFSVYYHYYNKLVDFPTKEDPEIDVEIPCLPLLKYDEIPSFLHPDSPYPFLATAILGQFKNMNKPFCVLMDTFQELEPEAVEYMSKICRPIKTIGPLFKELKGKEILEFNEKKSEIHADFYAPDDCFSWLDSQPPRSVVYISFGSVVQLKQDQVDELAYGLLSAGVSFLWVMRPPALDSTAPRSVLPEGFLEKAGEKGKIVQWSPQTRVLAHPSTACFVSHCGWNSTMEALTCGVPVVAFPQWGDQVTDAKFLVDVFRVGIRISRGEAESRAISRDEIVECLTAAISGPAATEMQANSLKWKRAAEAAVAQGGSSYNNARDFIDEILQLSAHN